MKLPGGEGELGNFPWGWELGTTGQFSILGSRNEYNMLFLKTPSHPDNLFNFAVNYGKFFSSLNKPKVFQFPLLFPSLKAQNLLIFFNGNPRFLVLLLLYICHPFGKPIALGRALGCRPPTLGGGMATLSDKSWSHPGVKTSDNSE